MQFQFLWMFLFWPGMQYMYHLEVTPNEQGS